MKAAADSRRISAGQQTKPTSSNSSSIWESGMPMMYWESFYEIPTDIKGSGALIQPCCLAEPIIKCHFKDKPSKIPCRDYPAIDKGGKSFW